MRVGRCDCLEEGWERDEANNGGAVPPGGGLMRRLSVIAWLGCYNIALALVLELGKF